jgi:hypothetical protein
MYLFTLDYANRVSEKEFIKQILTKYDNNKLVGANLYVCNNPYKFEFYLYLNFEGDINEFENWLKINYPNKKRIYNYFVGDFLTSMGQKGYNSIGLMDGNELDYLLTSESNFLFLFPDKQTMGKMWAGGLVDNRDTVFLSHSSKDKLFVDRIFDSLQKSEIKAWYDKYEMIPGDSILDKINEGLSKCNIGILILSKNFFNASTGWTKKELNYYLNKRINTGTDNFVILNIDLEMDELPPLLQEYLYIDMKNLGEEEAIKKIVETLRIKLKSR